MTSQRTRNRSRSYREGITLLEIVLSLALIAIAMTLLAQLVSIGNRAAQYARDTSKAQLYCESVMAEVVAGLLPADANWSAFGISRMEFSIVAQAASQGGNCRVGLEDNLYLGPGEFAGNLQLVERAVRIIRELGREPATPAQAARRLGINR